jgi:hypothetical protein
MFTAMVQVETGPGGLAQVSRGPPADDGQHPELSFVRASLIA